MMMRRLRRLDNDMKRPRLLVYGEPAHGRTALKGTPQEARILRASP